MRSPRRCFSLEKSGLGQLIQEPENPRVGGSIPPLGTNSAGLAPHASIAPSPSSVNGFTFGIPRIGSILRVRVRIRVYLDQSGPHELDLVPGPSPVPCSRADTLGSGPKSPTLCPEMRDS